MRGCTCERQSEEGKVSWQSALPSLTSKLLVRGSIQPKCLPTRFLCCFFLDSDPYPHHLRQQQLSSHQQHFKSPENPCTFLQRLAKKKSKKPEKPVPSISLASLTCQRLALQLTTISSIPGAVFSLKDDSQQIRVAKSTTHQHREE